jgi:hypothetical protein
MKARKLGDYPRATTLIDGMPEEAVVSRRACDPAEHKRMKSLEQMILNGGRGVENFAATRRSRTGDLLITKNKERTSNMSTSAELLKKRALAPVFMVRSPWCGNMLETNFWLGNWNGARTTRSASTKRVKTACQANSATRKDD